MSVSEKLHMLMLIATALEHKNDSTDLDRQEWKYVYGMLKGAQELEAKLSKSASKAGG